MAKKDIQFKVNIDAETLNFFKSVMPERLQRARKAAVETAGMIWADAAKEITRSEDHVDTSLYINSIGYVTGEPASESDVIHELDEQTDSTVLRIGSSVDYAAVLEKRYAIMARGIDAATPRIRANVWRQVKKELKI
jgi:adenylate kinase